MIYPIAPDGSRPTESVSHGDGICHGIIHCQQFLVMNNTCKKNSFLNCGLFVWIINWQDIMYLYYWNRQWQQLIHPSFLPHRWFPFILINLMKAIYFWKLDHYVCTSEGKWPLQSWTSAAKYFFFDVHTQKKTIQIRNKELTLMFYWTGYIYIYTGVP